MPVDTFAIIRYDGIVYLIKKVTSDGKEPYDVYTYDLENPVRIGTWTNTGGLVYTNDTILENLKTAKNSEELKEKCSIG
jgi:hypothetical protein